MCLTFGCGGVLFSYAQVNSCSAILIKTLHDNVIIENLIDHYRYHSLISLSCIDCLSLSLFLLQVVG